LDDINTTAISPAYRYVVREVKKAFPDTTIALHTHNDNGLGAASLYAGVEGGAEIIDASVNGLGERAGIPALAEVAAVMQIYYGIDTGIKLEKMKTLSQLVADLTKYPVPPKMPYVGEQVFSHLTEGHYKTPVDGYWAYMFLRPSIFGNRQKTLLGAFSGPSVVRSMAKELGITIPDDKLEAVAAQIRLETLWRKRKLQPEDFLRIVEEVK
jgi:isopropylmalate/homocitrate/citramalate synthase